MRINRVELTGFGPYKGTQTVDFDAFRDDGIFLIGGKTGAGKSSILDAITFALYDSAPRYEGTRSKLRSDHCGPEDPTLVVLEFSAGDTRYRVERSPEYERPKKRGEGLATQAAEVRLFVQEADGSWRGVAARAVDVGREIARAVQLSKDQFLQVILLAQNRFQEFLLAKSEERQTVLRTLFGTRRFDDYEQALLERRRVLAGRREQHEAALTGLCGQFAKLLEVDGPAATAETIAWMDALLTEQDAALGAATAEAERADAAWQTARAAHEERTDLRGRQQRRATAAARVAELTEAGAGLERTAQQALAAAADHVGTRPTLEAAGDALAELAGRLTAALTAETSLPGHKARIAAAEQARARHEERLAATREQGAGWRASLDALGPRLEQVAQAAADETAAQQALDTVAPALTALRKVASAEAELGEKRRHELEAGEARTRASSELDALRRRRLDGHAAELAAQLVDGEECPVCGATEHPRPATWSGDAVTEDDIAAAERALAAAEERAAARTREAAAAEAALAELRGAAGGRTLEAAAAEQAAANDRLAAARTARSLATELRAEQVKLQAQLDGLDATLEGIRAEREQAVTDAATAVSARDEARATIDGARADFESVKARSAAVTAAQTAVRTAADQLRTHRTELAKAQGVLAEPELQGLPEGLADVAETQAALAAAGSARDAARDARTALEQRLTSARDCRREAQAAHEASAAVAADYEVVDRLAATVHGDPPNARRMRLESFVLAAELEEIVAAANARLTAMSGGRYLLEHDAEIGFRRAQAGLGLRILDQHTGLARPTQSLSGGETFLASLALALGLAEVVTGRAGGVRLDTLFIDEGFGSLDAETLEIAMGTLDSLRAGGRTVGLISHVEAMKEQIPAKLQVDVADGGWSVITQ